MSSTAYRILQSLLYLLVSVSAPAATVYNYFPPPGLTYDGTNHTLTSNEPVGVLLPGFSVNGDSTSAPAMELIDNGSAANNKKWWWLASGVMGMYAVSDAGVAGQSGLQINRSGTNITQSALLAGSKILAIKSTGDIQVNANTGTSGQSIVSAGSGVSAAWGPIDLSNANAVINTLPLANILTCATTQIVFDSAGSLVCSSKFTWTDSPGTESLVTAGPSEIVHWQNSNGLTNQKNYDLFLDASGNTNTPTVIPLISWRSPAMAWIPVHVLLESSSIPMRPVALP
jgi:hypothetical protein